MELCDVWKLLKLKEMTLLGVLMLLKLHYPQKIRSYNQHSVRRNNFEGSMKLCYGRWGMQPCRVLALSRIFCAIAKRQATRTEAVTHGCASLVVRTREGSERIREFLSEDVGAAKASIFETIESASASLSDGSSQTSAGSFKCG